MFSSGKVVTNTVQNYFKLAPKYDWLVSITQTGNFMDAYTYDYNWILNNLASSETAYGQIVDSSGTEIETLIGTKAADSYKITNANINNGTANDNIYDFAGNDSYQISAKYNNSHACEIRDYKGNDNYIFENETNSIVYDLKGNDIYKVRNDSTVNIEDSDGKDLYNLFGAKIFNINDNAGNDNYTLFNSGRDSSQSKIEDLKGKDKYNFSNVRNAKIIDRAGNDKYNIINGDNTSIEELAGNDSYVLIHERRNSELNDLKTIEDLLGNDKYQLTGSSNIRLKDKEGKDKYDISYTNGLLLADGEEGQTKGGNDKYNLSYITCGNYIYSTVDDYAGNDSYNISFSEDLKVQDAKGSDVYNIKDAVNMLITDNGIAEKVGKKMNNKLANDKYTFTNSSVGVTEKEGADIYKLTNSDATITDNKGADKYTVSGYYKTTSTITDSGASADVYKLTNTKADITDDGGKDSYNITSSYANIQDNGQSAKDSYTANMKGSVIISDDGGNGDTLKLNGVNKNNLVFMVDYTESSDTYVGAVYSGNLIIFDKTAKGFIEVKDYFSMESSYIRYTDTSKTKIQTEDGCIETIYAGKTNVINNMYSQLSGNNVYAISASVASWLKTEGHEFDSVSKLLETGSAENISDFIATFVQQ